MPSHPGVGEKGSVGEEEGERRRRAAKRLFRYAHCSLIQRIAALATCLKSGQGPQQRLDPASRSRWQSPLVPHSHHYALCNDHLLYILWLEQNIYIAVTFFTASILSMNIFLVFLTSISLVYFRSETDIFTIVI